MLNAYCQAGCASPPFLDDMAGNAANQTDVYIARGDGEELYTPSFTYHGFRYVGIEGLPDSFTPTGEMLTAVWVRTPCVCGWLGPRGVGARMV